MNNKNLVWYSIGLAVVLYLVYNLVSSKPQTVYYTTDECCVVVVTEESDDNYTLDFLDTIRQEQTVLEDCSTSNIKAELISIDNYCKQYHINNKKH